jgi:type VI secretion system protein ImpG
MPITKPHHSPADPELLDHYTSELLYARARAQEFAAAHPKVAARLGMHAGESGDPYVQRLVQASSFVNARTQIQIDRAPDPFTLRLLQCAHPNYVTPLPSMALVQFHPGKGAGQGGEAHTLPRGTPLFSRAGEGQTAVEFRTAFDVTVQPLELAAVSAGGIPPDIPNLYRHVSGNAQVRGSLRLRIRTTHGGPMRTLQGLDRLPVYLCGDAPIASHLFELIHTATLASVTGVPGKFATGEPHGVFQDGMRGGHIERAVEYEGLERGQSLLQPVREAMHGHNLLHEHMVFPQRFWFLTLAGLAGGLSRIDGSEAEIVLLLSREVGELAQHVDASQFALHCVPAINLYPATSERLKVRPQDGEHRLVPEVTSPDDHLLHSVNHITGQVDDDGTSEAIPFVPLDVALPNDERRDVCCFTVRRELELPPDNVRRYATHQPFVRTHTWLRLLRHDHQPDDSGVRYLSIDAWLTNGDLPCTLPRNGRDDLIVHGAKAVASVGFVRAPTMPGPPLARGEAAWQLIRQLDLEYGVFDDEYDEKWPGEGLRTMLAPYLTAAVPQMHRQLDGLTGAQALPVNGWHRVAGDMQFMRGIGITLEFDEAAFDGWSPFTFALVLERYLARHVSRHSFTRTTFGTKQRGAVFTWPARDGTREVF